MAVSAIGSGTSSSAAASSGFAQLSSGDFIRVMLSELKNQDPFQPQDSSKLLEQLSSLRNIESQLKLQEQLEGLVLQNQIALAGGLMGKMVVGMDEGGNPLTGLVTSVRVQSGKALLELDSGKTLAMERVMEIKPPAQAPAQAAVPAQTAA